MRSYLKTGLWATLGCCLAFGGLAQEAGGDINADENTLPDGRAARDLVFHHKGGAVIVLETDILTEDQAAQMQNMGGIIPYYGAIAMAPDEGMLSDSNQASANHHSLAAAEAAALAACNAARTGGRSCVVVLHFVPRDYEAGRALELSQAATLALRRNYRRGRGEKALAVSATTGVFAIEKGAGAGEAAIAACNAGGDAGETTATDCAVAVAD